MLRKIDRASRRLAIGITPTSTSLLMQTLQSYQQSPDVDLSTLAKMFSHLRQVKRVQSSTIDGSDDTATQGHSSSEHRVGSQPLLHPQKGLSTQDLESFGIEFIRYTWVDFTNVIRFRVLPIGYFHKILAEREGRVSLATPSLGLVYTSLAEGFNATGDLYLTPDFSSGIMFCPYEKRHCSIACIIEQRTPSVDSSPLCTKSALQRVISRAEDEAGVQFLVGFELEFVLLKEDDPPVPVGIFPFSSAAALRASATHTKAMELIARSILAANIELQMYHAEGGPGQYEVVTGPLPPADAVDALIHTREIIYNTAAQFGLRATFAPRVFPNGIGTGAHAHISVLSGKKVKSKELDKYEKGFLAGVLEHLPSITALTLPTPASYKRVGDGSWSGGTYVCWGTDHRECPIRLTDPNNPQSRRFEMRFMDGTANPYLAMAGILAAGTSGILKGYELKIRDCPGPQSAAQMTEAERNALGITKRMPLSWEEARANLVADEEIKTCIHPETVEKFLSVNKALVLALDEGDDESVKLKKLIELY